MKVTSWSWTVAFGRDPLSVITAWSLPAGHKPNETPEVSEVNVESVETIIKNQKENLDEYLSPPHLRKESKIKQ